MKPSSLRFERCTDVTIVCKRCDGINFGGFANVILEYVFTKPRSIRGMVDTVVYSYPVETEKGTLDRIARVDVRIENKPYFFYVIAETSAQALQEWSVIGWSVFMNGKIRMPAYDEMIWI